MQSSASRGPLPSLREHLPEDWWRTLFTATYLKTDGDVVENAENTRKEVDLLLASTGLKPEDELLDLCCGQGRHTIELANRGYRHLTGIDRSRYLIQLARKRAKQADLDIRFCEGDARHFRIQPGTLKGVFLMGNSFGYFEREEEDLEVLKSIHEVLQPGGIVALDLTDGGWLRKNYEPRSWEWIGKSELVARERELGPCGNRLVCREIIVHADKGVVRDQFYAERLYTWHRIRELLHSAGFEQVQYHGEQQCTSDRNQDLGMMANRMFITAKASRTAIIAAGKSLKVAVLLGDPRLPDPIKRDARFNPEDCETVLKLREALAELQEYDFHLLDRHAEMMESLRDLKPDLVLNFCDEGFHNQPAMELHIPALLEMLGLIHTGSGPTCLASCYNKRFVRNTASDLGIPTPLELFCPADSNPDLSTAPLPAFVKPNFGDGSFAIDAGSLARNLGELEGSIHRLAQRCPGQPFLIQEFLEGAEYTVSLIGNPETGLEMLPIVEADFSQLPTDHPPILGYESKFLPDSPYWSKITYSRAKLNATDQAMMEEASRALFKHLKCRDYARFDFRRGNDGVIKLLEVNPNPGWCWDGKMNIAAAAAGVTYPELLRRILETARTRAASSRKREHYQPTL